MASCHQESTERAGKATDNRYCIGLHRDIEDPRRGRDRIWKRRRDSQQLRRGPEERASEAGDLGLLLMVLKEKGQHSTHEVDPDRHQSDDDEPVTQAAVRRRART